MRMMQHSNIVILISCEKGGSGLPVAPLLPNNMHMR
jgi:hypothetical protein